MLTLESYKFYTITEVEHSKQYIIDKIEEYDFEIARYIGKVTKFQNKLKKAEEYSEMFKGLKSDKLKELEIIEQILKEKRTGNLEINPTE